MKPLKSGRVKTYSRPLHRNLEGHSPSLPYSLFHPWQPAKPGSQRAYLYGEGKHERLPNYASGHSSSTRYASDTVCRPPSPAIYDVTYSLWKWKMSGNVPKMTSRLPDNSSGSCPSNALKYVSMTDVRCSTYSRSDSHKSFNAYLQRTSTRSRITILHYYYTDHEDNSNFNYCTSCNLPSKYDFPSTFENLQTSP